MTDIEEEFKTDSSVFDLKKETVMSILGVQFPFQQFINLLISIWIADSSENLKQNVLKLLIYKIHRSNLEDDKKLNFETIAVIIKDEEGFEEGRKVERKEGEIARPLTSFKRNIFSSKKFRDSSKIQNQSSLLNFKKLEFNKGRKLATKTFVRNDTNTRVKVKSSLRSVDRQRTHIKLTLNHSSKQNLFGKKQALEEKRQQGKKVEFVRIKMDFKKNDKKPVLEQNQKNFSVQRKSKNFPFPNQKNASIPKKVPVRQIDSQFGKEIPIKIKNVNNKAIGQKKIFREDILPSNSQSNIDNLFCKSIEPIPISDLPKVEGSGSDLVLPQHCPKPSSEPNLQKLFKDKRISS